MDINATSILAYQLQSGRQQAGMAMMKQSLQAEQQTANLIANAIAPVGSADGSRGSQLDITV